MVGDFVWNSGIGNKKAEGKKDREGRGVEIEGYRLGTLDKRDLGSRRASTLLTRGISCHVPDDSRSQHRLIT